MNYKIETITDAHEWDAAGTSYFIFHPSNVRFRPLLHLHPANVSTQHVEEGRGGLTKTSGRCPLSGQLTLVARVPSANRTQQSFFFPFQQKEKQNKKQHTLSKTISAKSAPAVLWAGIRSAHALEPLPHDQLTNVSDDDYHFGSSSFFCCFLFIHSCELYQILPISALRLIDLIFFPPSFFYVTHEMAPT